MRAQVLASAQAVVADAAGDQRIQHHAPTLVGALQHGTDRFVAEDQWRHTSLIVAEIGVHIRPANANRLDGDQRFTGLRLWFGFFAISHFLIRGVYQCFHLAVKPPSTASVWPVI